MEKMYHRFIELMKPWEKALDEYSMEELMRKPGSESWSMGQLYMHLVPGTLGYHVPAFEQALNSSEGKRKRKNFKGIMVFYLIKGFPPKKIKVPPSDTYTPKQPQSKEALKEGMAELKQKMKSLSGRFAMDKGGKVQHPALGYLNAKEWYKLIVYHFEHHLLQKKALDEFLGK